MHSQLGILIKSKLYPQIEMILNNYFENHAVFNKLVMSLPTTPVCYFEKKTI